MPQYIPYSPIYIPEIQPYKPDFNFLSNVAQTRQSRYDASYKKIGEMYGNLLNSPMTRDENIQKRDAFFKAVDQDIKKMSGMDLSLQQNEQAAMQVFKGLTEDPDIAKDMAWTKNLHSAMQRGQALRLCADPKKCDGEWWEGGDQELQYRAQEFKNASREEALTFANPEYTAHYNVESMAIEDAKKAGFNMKVDTIKGGWIVTNEDGEMMQPSLADFFLHKFGSDPKVMKMYNSKAYLQRKNWTSSKLGEFNGDENAANLEYINQMMAIPEKAKAKQAALDNQVAVTKNNQKLAEDKVKKEGYSPDIDQSLKKVYGGLFIETQVAESAAAANKEQADLGENTKLNMSNVKFALKNMDQIVALNLLKQSTNTAATHFSNLNKKTEMKANPYALSTHTSNLALRNSLEAINANLVADIKRKEVDHYYKELEANGTAGLTGEGNVLEASPDTPGTGTKAGVINPKDDNYRHRDELMQKSTASKTSFVNSFVAEALNKYANTNDNKQKEWLKGSLTKVLANTGISVDDVLQNNLSREDINKLNSLGNERLTSAYKLATDYADPTKGGLLAASFFSDGFYKKHADQIFQTKMADNQLAAVEKQYSNIAKNVSNKVQGDFLALQTDEGKWKADIVAMYTSLNHRPLSKEEVEGINARPIGKQLGAKYADEHWKDYLKTVSPYTNPNNVPASVMMAAKKLALGFYHNNAADAIGAYNDEYQVSAPSWRQTSALGGKSSNALASMAHKGYYDKDVKGEQTDVAADWFSTYQQNSNNPNMKVVFGNASEMAKESDPSAQRVANVVLSDLKNAYKKGAAERPKFAWTAQEVAGGDPNYVAMTFYPDLAYMAKFEGTEKKPGLLAGLQEASQQGITMFFPKNAVDNKYTAMFKVDPIDYQYESSGEVSLDLYPDVNVKFEKTASGPRQVLSYTYPGQEPVIETFPLGPNASIKDASMNVIPKLKVVQEKIDMMKAAYRKKNGTTDPNALM